MNANKQNMSLPPISVWQAEILRMTVFHPIEIQTAQPSWWEDLRKELPEAISLDPKRPSERHEGPFEEGRLVLTLQPGRIDWVFTIDIGRESNAQRIPTIGVFTDSLESFLSLMVQWLQEGKSPQVRRLAFGAVLLRPVESLKHGYAQILAYLPHVELGPEPASDFLYQINRPRDSSYGIRGLKINRISTWSVASFTMLRSVAPAGVPAMEHFRGPERFACRLALDINTVPQQGKILPQEELPHLLQELVEFGKEITQRGDVP